MACFTVGVFCKIPPMELSPGALDHMADSVREGWWLKDSYH